MGLFRRIAGFLGLSREDEEEGVDTRHPKGEGSGGADDGAADDGAGRNGADPPTRTAAGGFAVQVPVAVERTNLGSVLVPCDPGEGGVQGFRWYARRLRMDEDGDVADEFLSEVKTEMLPMENQMTPPKLQAKYNTRSTAMAMRKQIIVADGNIHQSLEYQGRLQWV